MFIILLSDVKYAHVYAMFVVATYVLLELIATHEDDESEDLWVQQH